MDSDLLKYSDEGFPVRARKLIGNRQSFAFEISGEPYRQLLPHLDGGRIADPPKLGLKPKLQPLLGTLMLADAKGLAVSLEIEPERICVRVGVGRA